MVEVLEVKMIHVKYLLLILVILLASIVGFKSGDNEIRVLEAQVLKLGEIPTIREWQERLGCELIDGKLGPGWKSSETQRLWDEIIFNQYAAKFMTNTGAPK